VADVEVEVARASALIGVAEVPPRCFAGCLDGTKPPAEPVPMPTATPMPPEPAKQVTSRKRARAGSAGELAAKAGLAAKAAREAAAAEMEVAVEADTQMPQPEANVLRVPSGTSLGHALRIALSDGQPATGCGSGIERHAKQREEPRVAGPQVAGPQLAEPVSEPVAAPVSELAAEMQVEEPQLDGGGGGKDVSFTEGSSHLMSTSLGRALRLALG